MDEETTTSAPVDEGGNQPQPEPTPAPEAEQTPNADPEQTTEEPHEAEPSVDDELTDWATKKGLTLDSENATKAAKMAREAEKAMHQKAQKASELEKNLTGKSDEYAEQVAEQTGQDPELLKRLQRVEVKEAVRDFWNQEGIDRSNEPKMIEILAAKPHLAGDLDALYALAERQAGNSAVTRAEGGKAALKKLAATQQAAVPTGNATNRSTTPKTKPFEELSIQEMEQKLGFHRY